MVKSKENTTCTFCLKECDKTDLTICKVMRCKSFKTCKGCREFYKYCTNEDAPNCFGCYKYERMSPLEKLEESLKGFETVKARNLF